MTILEHLENERSCIAEALSIIGQAKFGLPFNVDLNYEVLSGWLALVELARLAGVAEKDLSLIVAFVGDDPFQEDSYDQDTFPVGGREALEGLQRLIDRVQPLVERLVAMEQKGTLFVLANPAGAICTHNDYGAYTDPWDALRDLTEVKRENPRIYLGYVQQVDETGKPCPHCGHPMNESADYDQGCSAVTWVCPQCNAVEVHRRYPPSMAQCAECNGWTDVNDLESTYCGSYCEECFSGHMQECDVCRQDREG